MQTAPRRWLPALGALVLAGAGGAAADPSPPAGVRLTGEWTLDSVEWDQGHRSATSHSHLVIRNTGPSALPQGWTLWFTAIGGSVTADRDLPVRRVVGSLFTVGPPGGLAALQPSQSLTIPLDHPGEIPRDDKGPTAPYAVQPGDPDHPLALTSYRARGPRRATPGVRPTLFTDPAASFAANADWPRVPAATVAPVLPEPRAWQRSTAAVRVSGIARPRLDPGLGGEAALAASLPGAAKGQLPVRIVLDPALGAQSPEAYDLAIDPGREIRLAGASAAGVFYGLQSLDQVLIAARQSDGSLLLPPLRVSDKPRFAYRGLLIDVARNFRTPAELRAAIDLMARFKLNRLHLHLSDDEGWRIAVPALPELTSVGARRGHSDGWTDRLPPAHGSGPAAGRAPGSGFYTGAEYTALLRYAHSRHVEVIPEIDLPGHARAAIMAMKARDRARPAERGRYLLSDPQDASVYESAQGYSDNALNPGLASADAFVEAVVAELARLHRASGVPLKVMHIGADEVPAGAWERSPSALARIASLGGGGKAALWNDWFERVNRILKGHGVAAMGWEELGLVSGAATPEVNPRFAGQGMSVEVWNNFPGSEGLANRLANAGYPVVLAPARSLYFDMVQAPDPEEQGHDWANVLPLGEVFGFDPLAPDEGAPALSAVGRANIAGIEGTLFSETVTSAARMNHLLMPRLLALAERAWAPAPAWAEQVDRSAAESARRMHFARFSVLLGEAVLPYVEQRFPNLAYRLPAPGAKIVDGAVQANYAWPGVTLRYARGDARPGPASPVLDGAVRVDGPLTIAAFTRSGRVSPSVTLGAAR